MSYPSVKLSAKTPNPKVSKLNNEISSRYYKQIEELKEVRPTPYTQKIFTITDMQNKELDFLKSR